MPWAPVHSPSRSNLGSSSCTSTVVRPCCSFLGSIRGMQEGMREAEPLPLPAPEAAPEAGEGGAEALPVVE